MKRLIAIAALLVMLPVNASAFDKMDRVDTGMLAAYTVLHVMDWRQTRQIAKNPNVYWERNPLLGKHPSVSRVNKYMLASLATTAAFTYGLPKKYRRIFLGASITVTGSLVVHNFNIGLRF